MDRSAHEIAEGAVDQSMPFQKRKIIKISRNDDCCKVTSSGWVAAVTSMHFGIIMNLEVRNIKTCPYLLFNLSYHSITSLKGKTEDCNRSPHEMVGGGKFLTYLSSFSEIGDINYAI